MTLTPVNILNTVAGSLVAKQKYSTIDEALWELALSAVRGKVDHYRRRIRRLENKYSTDFDAFTARLKGRATPAEEDDWLAWKSAQRMLTDWQQACQDLLHDRPR
jgi:hypothetical protein